LYHRSLRFFGYVITSWIFINEPLILITMTKPKKSLSARKRVLFVLITILICLVLLEIGLRLIFAARVGPSVLLYGLRKDRQEIEVTNLEEPTEDQSPSQKSENDNRSEIQFDTADKTLDLTKSHTVSTHENACGGYSKYFPNQRRVDYDKLTKEVFKVTINKYGFRGEDFVVEKAPGIIRIVNLGASSTFGYHDRDNETYPVYLEEILNERCGSQFEYEVINLGIPHLTSEAIYNLYLNEAVKLNPDVVTFYEGFNDAAIKLPDPKSTEKLVSRLSKRLIIVALPHNRQGQVKVSKQYLDRMLNETSDRFLKNIKKLRDECKKNGSIFIVSNQQATSKSIERKELKGITYQQEVEMIRQKISSSEQVSQSEFTLLVHAGLMARLKTWISDKDIPFVDAIEALDQDRDVLVSRVHLSPAGNRMIAAAMADAILKHTCKTPSGKEIQPMSN
jgi:lysophospholipase L1-like esterase